MIITRKQLADIESAIGHSCEVGVLAGPDHGDLIVRISTEQPDGQFFNYEYTFRGREYINDSWEADLERFKYDAGMAFSRKFSPQTSVDGLPLCACNGYPLPGGVCGDLVGLNQCNSETSCEHQIRHIVDASALISIQFCSRDGWRERTVNCIYFGPGAACSNGGPCDDQVSF